MAMNRTQQGLLTGAATGAMMGSVVPGIGTAVGAFAGAAIGGLMGAMNDEAADEAEEAAEDTRRQEVANHNMLAERMYEKSKQARGIGVGGSGGPTEPVPQRAQNNAAGVALDTSGSNVDILGIT